MPTAHSMHIICPACDAKNRVKREKLSNSPICGKCRGNLMPAQPIPATDRSFQRFIEKNELPVVVDFWAPWCGPCKQFAPVFAEMAAQMNNQACFIKLDTEKNQNIAARYRIQSIPTLAIFHLGREITRLSGALSKSQFKQWLQQHMP